MLFRRQARFEGLALQILEEKRLRAPATHAAARVRILRLVEFFGSTRLGEITEALWQSYVLERQKRRPGSKFFDDRKYMFQILHRAWREGIIPRVPKLWIPDRPSEVGREIQPEELERLLLAAGPELRFQIEIAFKMGLRLREMLRLRWNQIDLERKLIRLLPGDTKTRRGRELPINPDLITRFIARSRAGDSPFVFPSPKTILKPQRDNKTAWITCKEKARVCARWHDLRHTCATVMLRRGSSVGAVKKYLGMSEQVLTRIYQHLNIDDLWKVANAMADGKGG